jgi:hypothetical protein
MNLPISLINSLSKVKDFDETVFIYIHQSDTTTKSNTVNITANNPEGIEFS